MSSGGAAKSVTELEKYRNLTELERDEILKHLAKLAQRVVLRQCRSFEGFEEDPEAIVMQVLEVIAKPNIWTINNQPAYVFRVCKNKVIDCIRRKKGRSRRDYTPTHISPDNIQTQSSQNGYIYTVLKPIAPADAPKPRNRPTFVSYDAVLEEFNKTAGPDDNPECDRVSQPDHTDHILMRELRRRFPEDMEFLENYYANDGQQSLATYARKRRVVNKLQKIVAKRTNGVRHPQ